MQERVVDFDNPRERAKVASGVQQLRGRWRLTFVRYRPRRSDRQNRYYHPAFVDPYKAMLCDVSGELITHDMAHEDLKRRFLMKPVIDKETGVLMGEVVGSTTKLSTVEFNEYLDRCAEFLATLGIIVPDPSEYRECEDAANRQPA